MTFYESIFQRKFSMKLLGLLTTKHYFGFILGCPQDFNFARAFRPFSPVSTQPYQNGQAKCKSYGHFWAKLKHVLWLGDLKAFPQKNLFINRHLLLHKQQQARISLMREKGPWWILNSHWIIHRWVPKSQSSTNRAPTTSLVQRMAEAA